MHGAGARNAAVKEPAINIVVIVWSILRCDSWVQKDVQTLYLADGTGKRLRWEETGDGNQHPPASTFRTAVTYRRPSKYDMTEDYTRGGVLTYDHHAGPACKYSTLPAFPAPGHCGNGPPAPLRGWDSLLSTTMVMRNCDGHVNRCILYVQTDSGAVCSPESRVRCIPITLYERLFDVNWQGMSTVSDARRGKHQEAPRMRVQGLEEGVRCTSSGVP